MNQDTLLQHTRRHFFNDCGIGVGKIALAGLLSDAFGMTATAASAPDPMAARPSHFPGRAKAVIQLFMAGAPSQLELFLREILSYLLGFQNSVLEKMSRSSC